MITDMNNILDIRRQEQLNIVVSTKHRNQSIDGIKKANFVLWFVCIMKMIWTGI